MRHVNKVAMCLGGAVLMLSSGVAYATDARELVIEKNEGLVEVPRHLGQVLTTPSRNFSFDNSPDSAQWQVVKSFERPGVFSDRNKYLRDPDNLFHQTTYFEFNDDWPIESQDIVNRVRDRLGPLETSGLRFVVIGHADEVGSQAYNRELSLKRARSVADLLVESGYSLDQMEVIGRGKLDPASFTDQALNRRVQVVVRGDKDTIAAYKRMQRGGGALTCRGCPPVSAAQVSTPIGQQGAVRQPSEPVVLDSGLQAPAKAPEAKPPVTSKEPTATMRALRQLEDAAKAVGATGAAAANASGFRADQLPFGKKPPEGSAPSLQDIFTPQAFPPDSSSASTGSQ